MTNSKGIFHKLANKRVIDAYHSFLNAREFASDFADSCVSNKIRMDG